MSKPFDPPIVVSLYHARTEARFSQSSDLERWAKEEEKFWEPVKEILTKNLGRANHFLPWLKAQLSTAGEIVTTVNSYNKQNDPSQLRNIRDPLEQMLLRYARQREDTGPLLTHDTLFAPAAVDLLLKEPAEGLSTLVCLQLQPIERLLEQAPGLRELAYRGLIEATFIRHGISGNEAIRTDLAGSYATAKSTLEEGMAARQSLVDAHGSWMADSQKAISSSKDQWKEDWRNVYAGIQEQIGKWEQRLSDLQKTYNEQLALQAPVTYWNDKRWRHAWVAWISLAIFIIAVASFAVLSYKFRFDVLEIAKLGRIVKNGSVEYDFAVYVLLAFPLFLAVWLLRLIVRIFVQNLELQTDASERTAMVKTFLALMKDGEKVKQEDRAIVLHALFRSMAVKAEEDGIPPSLMSWFQNIVDKK